jgi:hypothetical protein
MPRRPGRKAAAPSPRGLHLARGLVAVRAAALGPQAPALLRLLWVQGQARAEPLLRARQAAAEPGAPPQLGLAQARPRVLAPALVLLRAPRVPRPLVPPVGVAPQRVRVLALLPLLLRALALALARRLPGQGRARREPLCRGVPGLVPPHVSSQPRPVRSWIGHG